MFNAIREGVRQSKKRVVRRACCVGCLLFAAVAWGDVITLKNGNTVKGKVVSERGSEYVIKVGSGTLTVPRSEVVSIERKDEAQGAGTAAAGSAPESTVTPPANEPGQAADEALLPAELKDKIDTLLTTFDSSDVGAWDAAEAELVKMGAEIVPYLLEKSKSVSAAQMTHILRLLKNLTPADSVDVIAKAVDNEDRMVRDQAVALLGELKDPRGFDPLVKALKDRKDHVRQAAATSLGQLGDLKAVPHLIPLLSDVRPAVVEAARATLTKLVGRDLGPEKSDWEAWWRLKSQTMKTK